MKTHNDLGSDTLNKDNKHCTASGTIRKSSNTVAERSSLPDSKVLVLAAECGFESQP